MSDPSESGLKGDDVNGNDMSGNDANGNDASGNDVSGNDVNRNDAGALDLRLILGGVRAGKSARALSLARVGGDTEGEGSESGGVLFVATARALDEEMHRRIAAHRSERPAAWETLESPLDLGADIERRLTGTKGGASGTHSVVVIDCITLWVSNVLLGLSEDADAEAAMALRTTRLIEVMRRNSTVSGARRTAPRSWIAVSNEVGLGVVPPTPLGRRYRDALGRANQLLAAAARDVTLMVAGIELVLKSGR